jgi:protein disulfide isomerase
MRLHPAIATLVVLSIADAKVAELTMEDFSETIEAEKLSLVMFYAPWCSHCKELEPVYTEAAAKLSKLAHFSKVDATVETKLASRYEVSAYPTVLVFHSGTEIGSFGGDRSVEGISEFVSRFNSPASTLMSSAEQLAQFGSTETNKRSNVIGLFKTKECPEYVFFSFVAQMLRHEMNFAETFLDDGFAHFSVSSAEPTVLAFPSSAGKKADGAVRYDGPFTPKPLISWLKAKSLPAVPMIDANNAEELVELGLPFFVIFVEADVADMVADAQALLLQVREKYESRFTFLTADGHALKDQVSALGLDINELPQVAIDEVKQDRVYPFKHEITADNLLKFAEDFVAKRLKPMEVPGGDGERPPPVQPEKGKDERAAAPKEKAAPDIVDDTDVEDAFDDVHKPDSPTGVCVCAFACECMCQRTRLGVGVRLRVRLRVNLRACVLARARANAGMLECAQRRRTRRWLRTSRRRSGTRRAQRSSRRWLWPTRPTRRSSSSTRTTLRWNWPRPTWRSCAHARRRVHHTRAHATTRADPQAHAHTHRRYFYTKSCVFCKEMAPELEEAAKQLAPAGVV